MRDATTQPPPAAPSAPQPPSGDAARMDAALSQARDAAAQAERAAGVSQGDGRGERLLVQHNGKTVSQTPDGGIIVRSNGKVTTITPGGIVIGGDGPGLTGSTGSPFPPSPRDQIPDGVVPLIGTLFGLTAATIVLFPIARAFARRMDRKSMAAAAPASPEITTRLDRIEGAVEAIAVEVERVSEAQRYSARLLTERLPENLPRVGAANTEAAR